MTILDIALCGVLAFSSAGLSLFQHPDSAEDAAAVPVEVIQEQVVVAEMIQRRVQSLEERGDAMLFDSEALSGLPFAQAIVMPFD